MVWSVGPEAVDIDDRRDASCERANEIEQLFEAGIAGSYGDGQASGGEPADATQHGGPHGDQFAEERLR